MSEDIKRNINKESYNRKGRYDNRKSDEKAIASLGNEVLPNSEKKNIANREKVV